MMDAIRFFVYEWLGRRPKPGSLLYSKELEVELQWRTGR